MPFPPRQKIAAELCRRDFYFFIQEFWETIIPEKPVWNWHIEYLANELQIVGRRIINREPKLYDLIINVPPGMSKSTIVSILFPVWLWINDPTVKTITSSFAMSLSTNHAVKSRDVIRSDKFKEYFPEIQIKDDMDNKTEYETVSGGSRIATSIGSLITGKHGLCLIVDDSIDPQRSLSATQRITANEWVSQTLLTRKIDNDITPLILVQQRLHKEDTTGYLLGKLENVKHICLPAELSSKVQPEEIRGKYVDGLLDSKRLSKKILDAKRKELSEYAFAGQYDQSPVPLQGGFIKTDKFRVVKRSEIPDNLVRHFYSDTSEGKKTSDNMATGCFSLYDGNLVIWDMLVGKWGFTDFVGYRDRSGEWVDKKYDAFIKQHFYNWQSKCIFEAKSTGTPYMQYMYSQTDYNVIADNPVGSKLDRVEASMARVESGRVWLVDGPWIDGFVTECKGFSGEDGDEDDRVDVLTGMIKFTNFDGQDMYMVDQDKVEKKSILY